MYHHCHHHRSPCPVIHFFFQFNPQFWIIDNQISRPPSIRFQPSVGRTVTYCCCCCRRWTGGGAALGGAHDPGREWESRGEAAAASRQRAGERNRQGRGARGEAAGGGGSRSISGGIESHGQHYIPSSKKIPASTCRSTS